MTNQPKPKPDLTPEQRRALAQIVRVILEDKPQDKPK